MGPEEEEVRWVPGQDPFVHVPPPANPWPDRIIIAAAVGVHIGALVFALILAFA